MRTSWHLHVVIIGMITNAFIACFTRNFKTQLDKLLRDIRGGSDPFFASMNFFRDTYLHHFFSLSKEWVGGI